MKILKNLWNKNMKDKNNNLLNYKSIFNSFNKNKNRPSLLGKRLLKVENLTIFKIKNFINNYSINL